jgi:hypothetical protein
MEAMELFVTLPLLAGWLGRMPDLSDFADMVGNLKVFLIYLVLVWTLGALGEEIDYRRPPDLRREWPRQWKGATKFASNKDRSLVVTSVTCLTGLSS